MFALLGARIALTTTAALLAAAGLLIAAPFGMVSDFFPIFGGYLVFWLGFANLGAARRAGRYGDFSYGLYLWGWPAQQIVQTAIEPAHWLANVALATPLALAAAFVSWRLVEKPALAFKLRGPALKPAPAQAALKSFGSVIPGFAHSAEAAKGDTK
jgi:peptidoglycan/LPS O-acetylase OafA/YrhL